MVEVIVIIGTFFNHFVNICIALMLMIKLFGINERNKHYIINTIVFSLIGAFLTIIELRYMWNDYIYLHGVDIFIFVTIGFCVLFIKGNFFSKFSIVILFSCSFVIIFDLSFYLYKVTEPSLQPISYLVSNFVITTLLLVLTEYIIQKHKIKTQYNPPFYYWSILMIIPILNFCVLLILEHAGITSNIFASMLMAMFIINIVFYITYSNIVNDYEDKVLYLMNTQYLQLQVQNYEEIKKAYNALNGFRHDLKNHILCMQIMLEKQQFEEVQHYFSELAMDKAMMLSTVKCGNHAADAVLSFKSALAYSEKIPFHIQISASVDIKMKDFELCAVLSNLLDNAMEASYNVDEPHIKVKITSLRDCLIFLISNKTSENILENNPNLKTTKKDKENHGVGISVVDSIIKQYGGQLSFYMEKGYFHANVVLPK
ncbi:hypothetical protein bsdtw1_03560 [Clostridium fungisolvens]|uniref:Sensor histidine kinase NatK-like C-terminal domain-containing protein n=2 Tax=Clostridium fungisolvens TaxID=1604897 RepID=A0A6V8SLK3_9CLOT|nr:hypothetical protein bsdtw1_03560 [Clostridium fungisolvens]